MRKPELASLTGIRFYLALFVYLSHAPLMPGMERFSNGYVVFNAGVVGVSCFFVLSGFILTYNYAEWFGNGVSGECYRRFVWDRLTRIYPVHLFAFLMALPIQIFSPNLPLDWRAVPFHLTLTQCWWPVAAPTFYNYLNVPSWSISCEWFFYLVAPLAIFCVLGKARFWVPVVLVLAYAAGLAWRLSGVASDYTYLYLVSWFAPSRLPEFLTGIFLARMFLRRPVPKSWVWSGAAQAAGLVLIVAGAMYRSHAPWPLWGGLGYLPGAALLVIGLAYGRGGFAAHLSHPWLNHLGRASFSLYMLQAPMLRATKGVFLKLGWEVGSWAGFFAVIAVMFLVIQGTALILHGYYEMPMQKRLRSFALQMRRVSDAASVRIAARGGVN